MEYLKISEEELTEYSNTIKSINALFSPNAKYVAKTFIVGTQKQTFYGNPTIMIGYSDLLSSILDWSENVIPLATNIELTDDNIRGFVVVWLMMNNLFPFTFYEYDINDLLIIAEWIDYFGYNNELNIEYVQRLIESNFDYLDKLKLNDSSKILLKKRHDRVSKICLSDPLSRPGIDNCSLMHKYASMLGINTYETWLAYLYAKDPGSLGSDITNAMDLENRSINDMEKQWVSRALERMIKEYDSKDTIWTYRCIEKTVGELSRLIGREKDPKIIKIIGR